MYKKQEWFPKELCILYNISFNSSNKTPLSDNWSKKSFRSTPCFPGPTSFCQGQIHPFWCVISISLRPSSFKKTDRVHRHTQVYWWKYFLNVSKVLEAILDYSFCSAAHLREMIWYDKTRRYGAGLKTSIQYMQDYLFIYVCARVYL